MYLSVDPGKGAVDSIGVAIFKSNGDLIDMGQLTFPEFITYLDHLPGRLDKIICEDYKIFKRKAKAHIGSRVETAQTIGALRGWATKQKVEIIYQDSSILTTAQKLFQITMPADHTISHQFSALLHGKWYLYNKGIILSALEKQNENRG